MCLDVMEKFCKPLGADGEKGKHLNKEAWNMSIVLELFLKIRWNWKQSNKDRNI